jgi:hypothetical protein
MWAQAPALLHVGFLSTLLLGVLGICFVDPRQRGEWTIVAFLGLFLVSLGEAYIGVLVRGPEGWPWDKGPFPYSPSLWIGAWPSGSWAKLGLPVLSVVLALGGLILLGMRWAILQADKTRLGIMQEDLRPPSTLFFSLFLLSVGQLLAWPTWSTIATWLALVVVLAIKSWQV